MWKTKFKGGRLSLAGQSVEVRDHTLITADLTPAQIAHLESSSAWTWEAPASEQAPASAQPIPPAEPPAGEAPKGGSVATFSEEPNEAPAPAPKKRGRPRKKAAAKPKD